MWQFFLILFALWMLDNFYWKRRNLPPGPIPLPLLGNLLTLKRLNIENAVFTWRKQYGDFFTVWFGTKPAVMIGDYNVLVETFIKDGETYAGRPKDIPHDKGIVMADGDLWKDQRRFVLHVFRNFGLGRNLMQERVLNEVSMLISAVKEELNKGVENISIQNIVDIRVGSIINSLTFGYSFEKEKITEFITSKELTQKAVRNNGNPIWKIAQWNPQLFRRLPFFSKTVEKILNDKQCLRELFEKKVEVHKNKINFEADQEPTDYAEAFLRHQYKLNKDGVKDHYYTDFQLVQAVVELWIAGQETTSNTLAWMILYMMENPEIQKKAHEELDNVIGNDRLITLEDKTELNYINAIIAETQRYCNLAPVNVFHSVRKDVTINGYKLPKDTLVIPQICFVMFNEKHFPNPNVFNPERFLDKNGKFFQPPELMPFSLGKRICLGEGLARLELFLFTANILNQFKLNHPKNKKADMTRIVEGPPHPHPFVTFIKDRY
jgi:cytochrome P450